MIRSFSSIKNISTFCQLVLIHNLIVVLQVCAVVGGMADQKQERLLKQHPQIVVATPGRLWNMIEMV